MNEERLFLIDICYKCSHNLNNKRVYIFDCYYYSNRLKRTTSVFITSLNLGLQNKVSEVVI